MSLLRNDTSRPEMGTSFAYRGAAQDANPYPPVAPAQPVAPQRMYSPDEAQRELTAFYAQQDAARASYPDRRRGRGRGLLLAGVVAAAGASLIALSRR